MAKNTNNRKQMSVHVVTKPDEELEFYVDVRLVFNFNLLFALGKVILAIYIQLQVYNLFKNEISMLHSFKTQVLRYDFQTIILEQNVQLKMNSTTQVDQFFQ